MTKGHGLIRTDSHEFVIEDDARVRLVRCNVEGEELDEVCTLDWLSNATQTEVQCPECDRTVTLVHERLTS